MDPRVYSAQQVELALRLRRLTVTEFADRLGVTRRTITNYLNSSGDLAVEIVARMAEALEVPIAFLYREPLEVPSVDSISFRSLSRMKAVDRNAAIAFGGIAIAFSKWLDSNYVLPEVNVPDLQDEQDPTIAASYIREAWGWGEKPIPNVVHMLEKQGVRVFSLAIPSLDVDAFSTWHDHRPYVFLNTAKSAERSRFDAAHELAHLVLHRHGQLHQRNSEQDANAFASAFLMPSASVKSTMRRNPSLLQLISKKQVWGVSVAALAFRCRDLGLYTEWEYRSIATQIAQHGYRSNEPNPREREDSQVLGKVLQMMRDDNIQRATVANELNVALQDLDTLMFGLTMTSIAGGRTGHTSKRPQEETTTPRLRLIQSSGRTED